MNIDSTKEFFKNMRHIPTEDSQEYDDFFAKEAEKCEYGVTINGVFIHGWLYWHLNHWNIYVDYLDKNNNVKFSLGNPQFRDTEWLIAENLKKAEDQKKGLMLFGSRQLGKTETEASYIGRAATLFQGSQNVIASGSTEDTAIVTVKIDRGLTNLHPYFRFDKLKFDWSKRVELGYEEKKKGGRRFVWSEILIRNFDEGRKTEALAGITPTTLVLDEIAKTDFLQALRAAQPALGSMYGYRCIPLISGTGGQFKVDSDAEKLFWNPDLMNFLAIELPNTDKKTGVFISRDYRREAKELTTFGKWHEEKNGILLPKNSELYDLGFYKSNPEKAKEETEREIAAAEKANDTIGALKLRMYFPETPEDCFLSDDVNPFPVEAIRQHLSWLDAGNDLGKPIKLFREATGEVKFSYDTSLRPVLEWPVTPQTNKNAPIIMYEPPMDGSPHLLYVAGHDPYNTSKSITSESLGTTYIYKRIYDLVNGTFQQCIVASYASRPPEMKEWAENTEMLLELYNATGMTENVGTNFIEYLKNKHKDYLLADGYSLLKQISPKSHVQQSKGLPPTISVINHCMNLLYEYCKEELEEDVNGIMVKRLGVTRIPDRMLLIEMLNYRQGGNYDRIVAFRHALAYDSHLVRIAPTVKFRSKDDVKPVKPIQSPFLLKPQKTFSTSKKSSFRL